MKKIICLILAVTLLFGAALSLTSCKKSAIYELAATSRPTKTVTFIDYVTKDGETLEGDYIMEVEGDNSIFTYSYERYFTPEESFANENYDRIKTVEGVIYYKDGLYSTDGDEWEAEVPSTASMRFNLDKELLTDIVIDDSDTVLEATIPNGNLDAVLGTNLSAAGDVKITVETNGANLTKVLLVYTTGSGATVSVLTSYSYNPITLEFPSN